LLGVAMGIIKNIEYKNDYSCKKRNLFFGKLIGNDKFRKKENKVRGGKNEI